MSIWRLVFREITHRKLNFLLGVISVSVAVACFVGALILLEIDDHRTVVLRESSQGAPHFSTATATGGHRRTLRPAFTHLDSLIGRKAVTGQRQKALALLLRRLSDAHRAVFGTSPRERDLAHPHGRLLVQLVPRRPFERREERIPDVSHRPLDTPLLVSADFA